jgi:hypothetical protein
MGTTYDIPGIGMLKLGELESAVSRMGSSAIRTILERGRLTRSCYSRIKR